MSAPEGGPPEAPEPGKSIEQRKYPESLIKAFIEQQSKEIPVRQAEIQVRQAEMELRRQELDGSQQLSMRSLELHAQDRREERSAKKGQRRDTLYAVGLFALLFAGLLVAAFAFGKDKLAEEALKALIYIAPTATGAYQYGKSKGRGQSKAEDTEED